MKAAKVDINQAEIVEALRKAGAIVVDTHRLGDGFPDLLVAFRGRLYFEEVKSKDGKLNQKEVDFMLDMASVGVPVSIVRTPEEALRIIGAVENEETT